MKLDFWYNHKISDVDKIDIAFYPNNGHYAGNMYKDGKMIGDYTSNNSIEIENTFSHLKFNWD